MRMKRGEIRANGFFVEIILVILFFSVSVAVTLQLFVAAGNKARDSQELNRAVICAQDAAERVRAAQSGRQAALLFADAETDNGAYVYGYDKDWARTQQNPRYRVSVNVNSGQKPGGETVTADIRVEKLDGSVPREIYTLQVRQYLPG